MDNLDIIKDFPILQRATPTGNRLIYLDSAATALKPACVIDAVSRMLSQHTANIHRSVHFLSDEATELFEGARDMVAALIGAESNGIVFVKNTTEALNLVASCLPGINKVVCSVGEHHSNYLPWNGEVQRLALDAEGSVDMSALEEVLKGGDIDLVSIAHVSNVTGNVHDVKGIVQLAHQYGAKVVIDAAQSAPHCSIDVTELDCDFLAFSGHKLGAPTGVGVLYGKPELLESMGLYQRGGATVEQVSADGFVPRNAPWKFEAGTPAIESVVGLSAAVEYLLGIGMDRVQEIFSTLSQHALAEIQSKLPSARLLGSTRPELGGGPYSFYFDGISPHVLARGLSDRYSVCVRSGFHCAQPLHDSLGSPASLRISFWIYNTAEDITTAVDGIASMVDLVNL